MRSRIVWFFLIGAMMGCMGTDRRPETLDELLPRIGDALPKHIGSWHSSSPPIFHDPETLFQYINGHAEVYLAYDFRGSVSLRYFDAARSGDLVVDVFAMATPADAFGVFTHDQDGEEVEIGQGALFRYGWLSFWKGPFFVSVYAESESDEAERAVLDLGRSIAVFLPLEGSLPAVVTMLPPDGLGERSVRYLHHPNILTTHLPSVRDNPLRVGQQAVAALGHYRRGDQSAHLLLVHYEHSHTADAARASFEEEFLNDDGPTQGPAGLHAMRSLPAAVEAVAYVLGATSKKMAEAVLDDAEAVAKGE